MGKGRKKRNYIVVVILALMVIAAAGVAARYLRSYKSDSGQATAREFYFTTDLLGDSSMVDESGSAGEGNTYSFPAEQSGTYYLYGGSAHAITIQVQNFSDTERITQENITYTASVTVETPQNSGNAYERSYVSLKNGDTTWNTGKNHTLSGKQQESDTLILDIPSYQERSYADGTMVTVLLASTAPYEKTIKLNFCLYSVDTALRYEVNDSFGSPYAELVIMTNVGTNRQDGQSSSTVQPYLRWGSDLSIDNTNNLTYTYNEAATSGENPFNQKEGMTDRSMQISRELNPGESESIYFFKSDTSKNYSLTARTVAKNEDGLYLITIGDVTAATETGR
jgi:hypothetical protein